MVVVKSADSGFRSPSGWPIAMLFVDDNDKWGLFLSIARNFGIHLGRISKDL